jgi:hypothetical protein
MTIQPATPPAVAAVVGGHSQAVPAQVTTEVNEHTPDPETPPVVEHVPDPPRPDTGGIEELKTVVAGLATAVASLTDLVTKDHKDESPTSVPWTHKGRPVHDE